MLMVAAPVAAAQVVTLSAGPAFRSLDAGTHETSNSLAAYSIDVSVSGRLSSGLHLRVGGGLVLAIDGNIYAPLPPGSTDCGCYATKELFYGRAGVAYERRGFVLGGGLIGADAGQHAPTRLGAFGEARVRPFRAPLDFGVLAYHFIGSTGRQRAVVVPTIGVRF